MEVAVHTSSRGLKAGERQSKLAHVSASWLVPEWHRDSCLSVPVVRVSHGLSLLEPIHTLPDGILEIEASFAVHALKTKDSKQVTSVWFFFPGLPLQAANGVWGMCVGELPY